MDSGTLSQWNSAVHAWRFMRSQRHDCTVPAVKDRKPGGKLERFHGASSLDTYAAGQHEPRAGWRVAKAAQAKARTTAKKARRA